ncbi:hypothetical protein FB45DRAFT_1067506 [Roridomyces roridus]|uniref:DUF6534 domain-containing protein n=1 Tax=Roridomyces roridus TaxID=1738132 RepID=A0AAD7B267_9AGAR|nr:hypothetical protein FB45DRAFT_1067506 [Roridomyces roridus]
MSDFNSTIPDPSTINETFGTLAAGIMVQPLLFGVVFALTGTYYWHFVGRDSKFYLGLVGVLLFLNVVEVAMDFHVVYRTVVVHFGDYHDFDLQTWTMWAEPGVTALVGCVAQVFFMERCWKLTDKSFSVFIALALLILLSLGSGLAVSVSFFQVKLFKLAQIPIPISFWLCSTAATDLAIATILCVKLWQSKTTFKRAAAVINKIMVFTIETSAVTAFITVLNLLLYSMHMNDAYHVYPQFSICRVYTITVLATLIARDQDMGVGREEIKVNTVVENDLIRSAADSMNETEHAEGKYQAV